VGNHPYCALLASELNGTLEEGEGIMFVPEIGGGGTGVYEQPRVLQGLGAGDG
jgi:hypothetical protein